jgi:hypothetical protein
MIKVLSEGSQESLRCCSKFCEENSLETVWVLRVSKGKEFCETYMRNFLKQYQSVWYS